MADSQINERSRLFIDELGLSNRILFLSDWLAPAFGGAQGITRATFENLCHELLDLIKQVTKHNKRENKLLEDAFVIDDGGEG